MLQGNYKLLRGDMEYKNFTETISYKSEGNYFKIYGYASAFNIEDNYGDIIEKGAFKDSVINPTNIKLLWQHDSKLPIGKIDKLYEDEKGLALEASINCELNKGREASLLLKDGVIDGLSIGFTIGKSHLSSNGNRIITDLKLWEVSIVTFPANNMAKIAHINQRDLSLNLEKIEKSIKQLKRSLYGSNNR